MPPFIILTLLLRFSTSARPFVSRFSHSAFCRWLTLSKRHLNVVDTTLNSACLMADQGSDGKSPSQHGLTSAQPTRLGHIPRILALDGGGVRGLSSLLIIEKLMREVQRIMIDSGNPTPDGKPPLPCEIFDLICGTSTGGLIAIMLGRLRMVLPC
jgi:Patatin-like phospholipase